MSRDLWNIAQALGLRAAPGGMLTVVRGTHAVRAATDDGIVHFAELLIKSLEDLALTFPCRRLIIDRHGGALFHLKDSDAPVDCMTCLVRGFDR